MKPFNLKAALEGAEVCTRDGRHVKIGGVNEITDKYSQLAVWIDGQLKGCSLSGEFWISSSQNDLFMAEKPKVKKVGWVNVYSILHPVTIAAIDGVFISEYDAKQMVTNGCLATIKIEWEEES